MTGQQRPLLRPSSDKRASNASPASQHHERLIRYGYTFDEAQEKILKYGTEAQRAATLCDVVSASVGGMNAELAKTDIGQMKQAENTIRDYKEKIGGMVQEAMKVVNGFNEVSEAASETKKPSNGSMRFLRALLAAIIANFENHVQNSEEDNAGQRIIYKVFYVKHKKIP